jgi:ABC-type phosphate transport system ATPase subunit
MLTLPFSFLIIKVCELKLLNLLSSKIRQDEVLCVTHAHAMTQARRIINTAVFFNKKSGTDGKIFM